ncbi:MAG: hypothetical protein WC799_04680 [Desulfobacteraceae bacterium]
MAEKQCPSCKMMIHKKAKVCPFCKKKFGLTLPAKIFLSLIILGYIGYLSGPSSKTTFNAHSTGSIQSEMQEVSLTKKGKKIKVKHQDWSNGICNVIGEKKIHIGMTAQQVKTAWGKPYKINTTSGAWGEHEQWVIHDSINSDYLYFENGILTSMQQSK